MSDTIQTVRWSLGPNHRRSSDLWLPSGRERPDDVLWASIRRTGLEGPLREAFQVTDPLWYGFWMDSPLTQGQCALLRTLLSDVAASTPRYRQPLQDFRDALEEALQTNDPLRVELTPPGHVDLGWVTTFVH